MMPNAPLPAMTESEALDLLSDLPQIVDLEQASRALSLSKTTLRRRVASGELQRLRSREKRGGRLLFSRTELARFIVQMSG